MSPARTARGIHQDSVAFLPFLLKKRFFPQWGHLPMGSSSFSSGVPLIASVRVFSFPSVTGIPSRTDLLLVSFIVHALNLVFSSN